ncbi:hypothetical protein, partial [Pseudoalteromonas obscura]
NKRKPDSKESGFFRLSPSAVVKTAHFTLRKKSALTSFAVASLLHDKRKVKGANFTVLILYAF